MKVSWEYYCIQYVKAFCVSKDISSAPEEINKRQVKPFFWNHVMKNSKQQLYQETCRNIKYSRFYLPNWPSLVQSVTIQRAIIPKNTEINLLSYIKFKLNHIWIPGGELV